jgi:hypothetical protein
VKFVFPVHCEYRGGNRALGRHGKHFWIEDGHIGHGGLRLTHSLPMTDVASVDVAEREVGGSQVGSLLATGATGGGFFTHDAEQVTDITVRTKDGQSAIWVVDQRGADWVRERLTPVLQGYGVPFYDDLPPGERADCP